MTQVALSIMASAYSFNELTCNNILTCNVYQTFGGCIDSTATCVVLVYWQTVLLWGS